MHELLMMLNAVRLELQNLRLTYVQVNAVKHGTDDIVIIDEAVTASTELQREADMWADMALKNARFREGAGRCLMPT